MADIPYRLDKKLIVVLAVFQGKDGERYDADLIVDTGASLTILDPSVMVTLGFTEEDKSALSTVQSPIGKEKGYRLHLPSIECLGKKVENFEVACHSLGLQHIDGLLGMNFLEQFDFCIFPRKNVIRI